MLELNDESKIILKTISRFCYKQSAVMRSSVYVPYS